MAARPLGEFVTEAGWGVPRQSLHPSELTITDWQPDSRFVWAARKTGLVMTADHVIQAAPAGCAVELVIEPGRAGLTPEQVRRLFREVLQRFESITNEDAAEEAREYPDER